MYIWGEECTSVSCWSGFVKRGAANSRSGIPPVCAASHLCQVLDHLLSHLLLCVAWVSNSYTKFSISNPSIPFHPSLNFRVFTQLRFDLPMQPIIVCNQLGILPSRQLSLSPASSQ